MNYVLEVEKRVAKYVANKDQSVAHKMDHFKRVFKNAMHIARNHLETDLEILQLAVLLHDVDQPFYDKKNHVDRSKSLAEKILSDVNFPIHRLNRVLKIIDEHSTEDVLRSQPSTIESKILFDADKIDGVGPSGIIRVFTLFAQMGREPIDAIPWYRDKIKTALENLQTEEGKTEFKKRLKVVEDFLESLSKELEA